MADLTDEQLAEIERDWEHVVATGGAVKLAECDTCAAAYSAFPLLLRALRDARADVERISGAWCEVIQREQRSDNAHWYDMTQLEAERGLLRAENERLITALKRRNAPPDDERLARLLDRAQRQSNNRPWRAIGWLVRQIQSANAEQNTLTDRIEAARQIAERYTDDHTGFDDVLAALAAPTGQEAEQ